LQKDCRKMQKESSYLELCWLPNSVRKQVPYLPDIYIDTSSNPAYSGYYKSPHREYPRGIIVIMSDQMGVCGSAIAHEFRHHWQMFNGFKDRAAYFCWTDIDKSLSYEQKIGIYFQKNLIEMDALLFESKVHPVEYQKYWLHCVNMIDT